MKAFVLAPPLICVLLSATSTHATIDSKIEQALRHKVKPEAFSAQLKEGFHFNDKAPNSLIVDGLKIQPTELTSRNIEFGLPDKYKGASAELYICDDALTFCKVHRVNFGKNQDKAQASAEGSKATPPSDLRLNSHGFYEGDIQQAAAKAKKENKLLLIDFAARWCPGCVRLEQEIFGTKKFEEDSKVFVKLKVDMDRMENSVLGEKFEVKAIPTLLVATPGLMEVSRLIDYQPPATISEFLSLSHAHPLPLNELETEARKGDTKAARILAERYYRAGQYKKSMELYDLAQIQPPAYTDAKVRLKQAQLEKDPKQKPELIQTLKTAIAKEPQSSRSIAWRSSLIPLLESPKAQQTTLNEGLALVNQLQKDSGKLQSAFATDMPGEFTNYEPLLLAWYKVDLLSAAQASLEEISKAQQEAINIGTGLKIPASATGPSMRLLIFMTAAKDYDKAEKLARQMLKADPRNAEIQRRLIRVLNAQQKFNEAIPIARASLDNSYGRNQIWVARMLAEAYIGASQKDLAKKLITSYLAKPELGWKSMADEKKNFEELSKSL